ncbi:MAG: hypothetical protein QM628_17900 [Propionicimonas sp.]
MRVSFTGIRAFGEGRDAPCFHMRTNDGLDAFEREVEAVAVEQGWSR